MKKIFCKEGRVGALIVSCRELDSRYGPKRLEMNVSIGSVNLHGDEIRNEGNYENEHLRNLVLGWTFRVESMEEFNPRFYEVVYDHLYKVDFREANRMALTLKAIESGLNKTQRADGDFQTFGAVLCTFANLVGAKRIVLEKLGAKVRDYNEDRDSFNVFSLADGGSSFDLQIATLKQQTLKQFAIEQAVACQN